MLEVKPFIKCVDYWPEQIPPEKLTAYRKLIDEHQIMNHSVVVNRNTGSTVVEYYAIAPHEWILEQMKERCS